MAAGERWPTDAESIAAWAIRQGKWKASPKSAIRQCSREISRALREEYFEDPQGRRVRAKHPVTKKVHGRQISIWDDIRSAPREHIQMSFQQRRERIVGDCRQLKVDQDSYNDAHVAQLPIQIVFDFRDDLEELDAAEGAA